MKHQAKIFIQTEHTNVSGSSQYKTVKEIYDRFSSKDNLCCIQVGAHNGLWRDDPIVPYLKKESNWDFYLFEPNPEIFPKLKQNFINRPKVRCINAAVAEHTGFTELYYVPEGTSEKKYSSAISSIVSDRGRIREFMENWSIHKCPCITLDDFVSEQQIKTIDILQIDAEGYDNRVINSLNLRKIKPLVIHFEERHIPRKELEDCLTHLEENGYSIFIEAHPGDTTAYLPDAFEPSQL